MRICVLNPSYSGSDSAFNGHDPLCDPAPWLPNHEWSRTLIRKSTSGRQVRNLVREGFDVFVNLCDGAWDEDRAGIDVVMALERVEAAFTGATSGFYEPTRETMKRVCHYFGIATPRGVFARNEEDLELAASTLRFPLIVKHENSYGSIGMTRDARVTDPTALFAQGQAMITAFGGALVEEFVEGREFTVLVTENTNDPDRPIALLPVECRFPAGETFKHFDLKWKDFDGMAWVPCEDADLADLLADSSRKMFTGLNGTGYGRCDIRVDAEGRPHMLEINPNCGIFYPRAAWGSADVVLHHDPLGHAGFIEHIIDVALRRQRNSARRWEIRASDAGFGTFATVDIPAGEVIQEYEEQPHPLVSRAHVEQRWSPQLKRWFAQYAWPIGEDVYVMWERDPARWRPIDHSCDPNAWLAGLDLVARRSIRRGEPICIDYATFGGDAMEPFECRCGATECRRVVRGSDWRLPQVARYGDHVSDWVRRRRDAAVRA